MAEFTVTTYKQGSISPMNQRVKYTLDSSAVFIKCHTKGGHAYRIRSAMQTALEYLEEELKNNLAYEQGATKMTTDKEKHTPAPWEVIYDAGAFDESIGIAMASRLDSPSSYYCHYIWHSEMDSEMPDADQAHGEILQYEEAIATARLIAAAPELYDAALAARNYLCDEKRRADDLLPVIEALEAATCKARGEVQG